MKTRKDLLMGELIGKQVEVTAGPTMGITGIIVDETKHTITIKTKQGNKMVQKNKTTFNILADGHFIEIEGALLEQRPEDRIQVY